MGLVRLTLSNVPAPSAGSPEATSSSSVDPSWAPPAEAPDQPLVDDAHPRRAAWVTGIVVLGLVAVLGLVWGLGGFERRTDLLTVTTPGTLITTGPFEFTFTEVTAQKKKDFDQSIYWTLTVIGTGRTTGDITLGPRTGDTGTFVSKDVRSGEVAVPDTVSFGADGVLSGTNELTPGLPPVKVQMALRYKGSYVPGPTLRFVVLELTFRDASLIGTGEKSWVPTNHGYDLALPVRVLPDQST